MWHSPSLAIRTITALLAEDGCSLIKMLDDESLGIALQAQIPRLQNYFFARLNELMEIATSPNPSAIRSKSLEVLLNLCKTDTNRLIQSPFFKDRLNNIFISEDPTLQMVNVHAALLVQLLKSSYGFFLHSLENPEQLVISLVQHIDLPSIYYLFTEITDFIPDFPELCEFFVKTNIVSNLFEALDENDSDSVLHILCILNGLFDHIPISSPIFVDIYSQTQALLKNALEEENPGLAEAYFQLLTTIARQLKSEQDAEEENSDAAISENSLNCQTVRTTLSYFDEKLSSICDFILRSGSFNRSHFAALSLAIALIQGCSEIPDCVGELSIELFSKVFEHPFLSFLHNSFVFLFTELVYNYGDCEEIISRAQMREKISHAFFARKEKQMNASFWIQLHSITALILERTQGTSVSSDDASLQNNEVEWKRYLDEIFFPMEALMNYDYGGNLPGSDESSLTDISIIDESDCFISRPSAFPIEC